MKRSKISSRGFYFSCCNLLSIYTDVVVSAMGAAMTGANVRVTLPMVSNGTGLVGWVKTKGRGDSQTSTTSSICTGWTLLPKLPQAQPAVEAWVWTKGWVFMSTQTAGLKADTDADTRLQLTTPLGNSLDLTTTKSGSWCSIMHIKMVFVYNLQIRNHCLPNHFSQTIFKNSCFNKILLMFTMHFHKPCA